jgi:hypothetical protein
MQAGADTPLLGQGSTLSAAIRAGCACIFTLLAGAACQDKPDEAQPRPNKRMKKVAILIAGR